MQVETSSSALSCPSEPNSIESGSSGDIGEKKSQRQPSTLHNGRRKKRSTSRVVPVDSDSSTDAGPLIASKSRQMRSKKVAKRRRDLSDISSTSISSSSDSSSSSESSPLKFKNQRIKERRHRQRKRKTIRPNSLF